MEEVAADAAAARHLAAARDRDLSDLAAKVDTNRSVINSPDCIAASFDVIDELTAEHGVVTSEMVPSLTATTEEPAPTGRLARHWF